MLHNLQHARESFAWHIESAVTRNTDASLVCVDSGLEGGAGRGTESVTATVDICMIEELRFVEFERSRQQDKQGMRSDLHLPTNPRSLLPLHVLPPLFKLLGS